MHGMRDEPDIEFVVNKECFDFCGRVSAWWARTLCEAIFAKKRMPMKTTIKKYRNA